MCRHMRPRREIHQPLLTASRVSVPALRGDLRRVCGGVRAPCAATCPVRSLCGGMPSVRGSLSRNGRDCGSLCMICTGAGTGDFSEGEAHAECCCRQSAVCGLLNNRPDGGSDHGRPAGSRSAYRSQSGTDRPDSQTVRADSASSATCSKAQSLAPRAFTDPWLGVKRLGRLQMA